MFSSTPGGPVLTRCNWCLLFFFLTTTVSEKSKALCLEVYKEDFVRWLRIGLCGWYEVVHILFEDEG